MSVLLERLEREGSVPLERYGHQVGGHHMLFKFQDTLCKPVIAREHFFYQTVPPIMRRYIPAYHGVIDVRYVEQSAGEIKVVASSKEQPVPVPPSSRVAENGAVPVTKEWSRGNFPKCTTGNTIHSEGTTITSKDVENGEGYYNPWAIMCSHNMDQRLKELGGDLEKFRNDYMILENLTSKYHAPSVLDLKVGTRQHGDDARPDKVQKHIYTCSISTSSSLGVRMAGMQKYNASKNEYTFYDKYFGKHLTTQEFRQVVLFFLDNGICFRSDILAPMVRMLKDLRASIKALPSYRYFSSSLLVLYDGAECPKGLGKLEGTPHSEGNFDGVIQRAKRADELEINYSSENIKRSKDSSTPNSSVNHSHASGAAEMAPAEEGFMSDSDLTETRRLVDLRMIDFAHATHKGYNDPISYEGFDDSYLIGLDSLIELFTDLNRTYCENGCGLRS